MTTIASVLAAGPGPATTQDMIISWVAIVFSVLWLGGTMLSARWRKFNTSTFPWGLKFTVPVVLVIGAIGITTLILNKH